MAATTRFTFREHWRDLRRDRPGERFQARYERSRREKQQSGPAKRIVLIVIAIGFFFIGVVLTFIPGPAFVFFILAGALLAGESRTIARFMDWAEVKVRKILSWAQRRWRRLSRPAQVGLVVVAAGCGAAVMFLGYRMMRG